MKTVIGLYPGSGTTLVTDPLVLKSASAGGYIGLEPAFVLLRTATFDPCSPLLSVPTEVYNIDSEWFSCTRGISGFWDPPRVLQPASGPLTPDPTTTQPGQTVLKTSAAPASTVAPNTPVVTISAGPTAKTMSVIDVSSSSKSSFDPESSPDPGANTDPASNKVQIRAKIRAPSQVLELALDKGLV